MEIAWFKLIAPEICVAVMGCLILVSDLFLAKKIPAVSYYLSLITLVVATILTIVIVPVVSQSIFNGSFIVDRFACQLKLTMYVMLVIIYIYSKIYLRQRNTLHSEFFALTTFSLLGMMILISCGNYLSLYLGLELLVLPLYAMIVLVKNNTKYTEAAMKYFVIGSLGAGLLLYGISLIYGATGTIAFSNAAVNPDLAQLLNLGVLFVVAGVALEFGAVPFHMWLPDVYEGSPTAVTMVISTIPKIAILAMIYRLLTMAFPVLDPAWQQLFLILAVTSVIIGNLMAIAQNNLKRLLAYSTIGHVGFILLGLFVAPQQGYTAAIFYTVVYVFMALAAFAMIMRLTNAGYEADQVTNFRGLNKTNPWLAFIMLLIMFSLAGVPPLLGFYAKFMVLQAVIASGYVGIAIVALLATVVGAFYYLRVIWLMYFEEPELQPQQELQPATMPIAARSLVSLHGCLLLLLGIFPAPLVYFCIKALT